MIAPQKTCRNQRRNRLASAIALSFFVGCVGSVSTGCSSSVGARVASLNPFSNSQPTSSADPGSGWFDGTKNAAAKSRDAVAGWFGGSDEPKPGVVQGDETDPTSLAHKAEVTPEVFVANGRLWESTGNFEKAMESYAKALEKRPNDPEALSNIARLHFRQKNHTKAAEYFGKAIKEKPNDAGLYNDLGLTLSKLGNHTAAATTIEQALRLSPGSSRYANNLASVKFEAGDSAGALQALVENNKPAVAHYNMAYLHYKHGQSSESVRHLQQALACKPQAEADPATKRAVERSGELLAQLGNIPGINTGATQPGATIAAKPAAAPMQTRSAGLPAAGVQQAASGIAGANAPTATVQPASTGSTNATFGGASYKTPAATPSPANSSPANSSPANSSPANSSPANSSPANSSPAVTQPSQPATPTSGSTFALPPGFQLPQ